MPGAPHTLSRALRRRRAAVVAAVVVVGIGAVSACAIVQNGPRGSAAARSTAAASSGAAVVDAIGDGGPGAADWNSALAARIRADRPAVLLWSGDVRMSGTASEWALYDQNYGSLKSVTMPTPGNHDWASHRDGYDVEFGSGAPYADTTDHCNGVTLPDGWGLFSVNTYTRSACLPLLTAFLARHPGTRTIVLTHEPRFSGGQHGASSAQAPIWDAMKGHAFALVSGHDHDSQVIQADGMLQLVTGCAGADYYGVIPVSGEVYYSRGARDCTYDRLLLRATSVTVEAVHADGSVAFSRTYPVSAPAPAGTSVALFAALGHSAAFPNATGFSRYARSTTTTARRVEVTVRQIPGLAGQRVTVYVNLRRVGTIPVNQYGVARYVWDTARGQAVPYASVGSRVGIRTAAGTLVSTGTYSRG